MQDLNPKPTDCESRALTTRPHLSIQENSGLFWWSKAVHGLDVLVRVIEPTEEAMSERLVLDLGDDLEDEELVFVPQQTRARLDLEGTDDGEKVIQIIYMIIILS